MACRWQTYGQAPAKGAAPSSGWHLTLPAEPAERQAQAGGCSTLTRGSTLGVELLWAHGVWVIPAAAGGAQQAGRPAGRPAGSPGRQPRQAARQPGRQPGTVAARGWLELLPSLLPAPPLAEERWRTASSAPPPLATPFQAGSVGAPMGPLNPTHFKLRWGHPSSPVIVKLTTVG